jgi:hypothetical protein
MPAASSPINRWKKMLSHDAVASLEALVGDCLQESGYQLTIPEHDRRRNLRHVWMRTVYPALLDAKLWLKTRTPAGRFSNLSALEVSELATDGHSE